MGIALVGSLCDFVSAGWSVSLKSSLTVDEQGEELWDSRESLSRVSVSREWVPRGMIVIGWWWNAGSCLLVSSSSSVTEISTSLSSSASSDLMVCAVVVVGFSIALLLASSSLLVLRHFALLFLNQTWKTQNMTI